MSNRLDEHANAEDPGGTRWRPKTVAIVTDEKTKGLMPICSIGDWRERIARQDAFWDCRILDRPVVCMAIPKDEPEYPWPPHSSHADVRQRWMDARYCVDTALACALNYHYLGDALPQAWPNLGPEVFSAFFGCEMEFSETTSWAVPCLMDWSRLDSLCFSEDNPYWRKIEEITDALISAGRGLFYTGITDLHPGGDAVAAFRDPQRLNMDLLMHPDRVKAALDLVNHAFSYVFDHYCAELRANRLPVSCWMGIVSSRKWHAASNDFSCMISKDMFDEFFLPGITEECQKAECSIYHLDGPGALRHLDSILAIDGLNAVQWVHGAGNGRASDWLHVLRRIQDAGKGLHMSVETDELDAIMESIRPEGVWMSVSGVCDVEQGRRLVDRVARWR